VISAVRLARVLLATVGAQTTDTSLWITLGDTDQLVEADPYTFKEIRRITTDPKVHGLAFSADGSKVYVTSDRTGNFQVVDVRKGAVTGQIHLGTDPNQHALTKDGKFAYVPLRGEDAIAVRVTPVVGQPFVEGAERGDDCYRIVLECLFHTHTERREHPTRVDALLVHHGETGVAVAILRTNRLEFAEQRLQVLSAFVLTFEERLQ